MERKRILPVLWLGYHPPPFSTHNSPNKTPDSLKPCPAKDDSNPSQVISLSIKIFIMTTGYEFINVPGKRNPTPRPSATGDRSIKDQRPTSRWLLLGVPGQSAWWIGDRRKASWRRWWSWWGRSRGGFRILTPRSSWGAVYDGTMGMMKNFTLLFTTM